MASEFMATRGRGGFALKDDEAALLDHTDRWARERLYPLAPRMDAEEWWPADVFPELGSLGFLGVTVPEQYGGAGMGFFSSGLICQAMARWNHAFALSWVAHENLCLNNIYANGDEAQRERYLPRLCSGEWIGCLGLTEPGAGSDALGSMATTARREGEAYLINGSKLFITNGPVADVMLCYARTDPEARNQGISAFIVETASDGFHVAQKLEKMGFRGSQTAEILLQDCRVPAANLLGDENRGVRVVMSGLDLERAIIAPLCLGVCERALELSIDYARTRKQFGQAIGSFQMVQQKLADMYTRIESLRALTYSVLAQCESIGAGEAGRGEIHMRTAAAVKHAAETMHFVLDEAVQIHGGSGYIWETEINRLFRATKLLEIGAGTTEVRNLIIAGELLRA
jgi:isovaleryl-CoA dehydrogenase